MGANLLCRGSTLRLSEFWGRVIPFYFGAIFGWVGVFSMTENKTCPLEIVEEDEAMKFAFVLANTKKGCH